MVDSFVVHIYRRDAADPRRLNGTVERIGNGKSRAFATAQELWDLLVAELAPGKNRTPSRARAKAGNGTP
jgi:hypothetical protein